MEFKAAKFRRPVEIEGRLCAEVGLIPDDDKETPLLAYVAPVRNGGYEIVRLLRNDAHYEADWYDNNLHNAFEEIASEKFITANNEISCSDRDSIVDAVLGSAEVRAAVDELFQLDT